MGGIKFEAKVCFEYELQEGMTVDELAEEVIDQIHSGEYFPSRVKDVQVTLMKEAN